MIRSDSKSNPKQFAAAMTNEVPLSTGEFLTLTPEIYCERKSLRRQRVVRRVPATSLFERAVRLLTSAIDRMFLQPALARRGAGRF